MATVVTTPELTFVTLGTVVTTPELTFVTASPALETLVTLDEVRAVLGGHRADATGTPLLMLAASRAIERHCRRPFPPDVPSDVKAACLMLISHLDSAARHTGLLRSERIGDYQYDISNTATLQADLPPVVLALLAPHVHLTYV